MGFGLDQGPRGGGYKYLEEWGSVAILGSGTSQGERSFIINRVSASRIYTHAGHWLSHNILNLNLLIFSNKKLDLKASMAATAMQAVGSFGRHRL